MAQPRPQRTHRECPLCGASMHLREYEQVVVIPGMAEEKRRLVVEWICPDCDYFEDLDDETN